MKTIIVIYAIGVLCQEEFDSLLLDKAGHQLRDDRSFGILERSFVLRGRAKEN